MAFADIKNTLRQPKYFAIFVFSALGYFAIYYAILKFVALTNLDRFFSVFPKSYSYPAFALAIAISILIGINISLLAAKLNALKSLKSSATGFGIFASILATGCPSCAIGAFPLFMSLFGISASLGSLPFYGIELQLLSVLLLSVSIYYLAKPNVCK